MAATVNQLLWASIHELGHPVANFHSLAGRHIPNPPTQEILSDPAVRELWIGAIVAAGSLP